MFLLPKKYGRLPNPHGLVLKADQLHFNPAVSFVVNGAMAELIQIEMRAQFAVDTPQKIQIERGGNTVRIVVGSLQEQPRFLQIDANKNTIPRLAHHSNPAQKISGV